MHNLAQLLQQWETAPGKVLYRQYLEGVWLDYAAGQLLDLAARWQAAFQRAGLKPGERVALCMKNGVQWVAADMAAHGLGLVVVPLYVDDNADNMVWCMQDSGARLLISDHLRFLPVFESSMRQLPVIVLTRGEAKVPALPMDAFLPRLAGEFTIIQQPADTLATIVYTSGTTGKPKGVMLSHANILSNLQAILAVHPVYGSDVLLSVLPLSHMFERTAGYYLPLYAGAMVIYCRGVGELAEDLGQQQPTVIMAVPRLFERILARIDEHLSGSPVKRLMFYQAAAAGWRRFKQQSRFYDGAILATLHLQVAGPLAQKMGGRLRQVVMGGAALEQRVAETLIGLGVPLLQGYGLTEASPVVAVNRVGNNDPLSVGEPLPDIEIKLSPIAELMVRGPGVMQGYWNNSQATRQMIDSDGWLNTGDVVEIVNRRIYIRGRSKNILVLSNGEKIAPEDIEHAILQDPLFEQVMVVGEARPYLVLLAVSRSEDARELLKRANQRIRHLPRYARIRRVIVAEAPWDQASGLLTPTLKIKREAVYRHYSDEIDAVYRQS